MLKESRTRATRHYTNAKIALVGDSGVGKSGLALVLSRKPFTATESTHARKVVSFQLSETEVEPGWTETREVYSGT
jgi:GTPase SAR1 family protein